MMGPSHRVAGVVAWLAVVQVTHLHGPAAAGGVVLAAITSHGRFSPDMDIYPIASKLIPGGHRGITHWWLWPLLAVGFCRSAGANWWVPCAIGIAWASHVAADAVFGRIPYWPKSPKLARWRYWGVGFRTGGKIELWVAVPALLLTGVWLSSLIAQSYPAVQAAL